MAFRPDTVMDDEDEDVAKAKQNQKRQGQGTNRTPDEVSNNDENNDTESHNSTGRRSGLRTHDRHASWREVAIACHAKEGQEHE